LAIFLFSIGFTSVKNIIFLPFLTVGANSSLYYVTLYEERKLKIQLDTSPVKQGKEPRDTGMLKILWN